MEIEEEKSELEEKYNVVLELEGYVVVSAAKSYVVATPIKTKKKEKEEVRLGNATYHSTLHQALANLSQRLLKDKFEREDYKPTLENLIKTINEHIIWFEKITKGL